MPIQSAPAWRAKLRCPKHLVAVLERAVNALPVRIAVAAYHERGL
jgi:hypothetical protein